MQIRLNPQSKMTALPSPVSAEKPTENSESPLWEKVKDVVDLTGPVALATAPLLGMYAHYQSMTVRAGASDERAGAGAYLNLVGSMGLGMGLLAGNGPLSAVSGVALGVSGLLLALNEDVCGNLFGNR